MDQLLSISNALSVCEAMVEGILEKLDDLESPSIVSENLYLLLLLAGNCRFEKCFFLRQKEDLDFHEFTFITLKSTLVSSEKNIKTSVLDQI